MPNTIRVRPCRATSACSCSASASPDRDTLSLHDALPILTWWDTSDPTNEGPVFQELIKRFNEEYPDVTVDYQRSEEHTSELQSRENLVCRLLLEKKKGHLLRGRTLGRSIRALQLPLRSEP